MSIWFDSLLQIIELSCDTFNRWLPSTLTHRFVLVEIKFINKNTMGVILTFIWLLFRSIWKSKILAWSAACILISMATCWFQWFHSFLHTLYFVNSCWLCCRDLHLVRAMSVCRGKRRGRAGCCGTEGESVFWLNIHEGSGGAIYCQVLIK